MKEKQIEIEIYDKEENSTTTFLVEKISENKFKLLDNDFFNSRYNLGTEIEIRINSEGKNEFVRIVKESKFVTRRFLLNSQFKESEYQLLGDEIEKQGGHWEVGFGSVAVINLPKNSKLDLDQIFKIFNFKPVEIKE
ncbi:hypothetical protein I5M27_09140 [Adhaeribacter sp. BT258]|uniref:DUF4265 domain-containing protein n=1 Tax=Adhaeribacter terrigena TaxID=2793070 RepID=A0ABS1C1E1_9BACT|nr:hypothetical protein [Adhaeribacter terrigena]MBK0403148.1 hypothetical protein [Adhaeribacter terrigena]